jgi:hypothetical protein
VSAVALQSFGFGDQLVRVADRNEAAWFVANDVCAVLDIVNSRHAVSRLEEDERDCVVISDAMGRERETTVVSESGVFALIFRSRKPAARAFRKWVTSEVLPAIRRTGRFEAERANDESGEWPALAQLPEAPDEFERVRVRLQLVREARIAFGTRAARKMWAWAGLPDLCEPSRIAAAEVLGERYRSVIDWMEARTEVRAGNRMSAAGLYADYRQWLRNEGRIAELQSQTGFGRALTECGFIGVKIAGGRMGRVGLKLND